MAPDSISLKHVLHSALNRPWLLSRPLAAFRTAASGSRRPSLLHHRRRGGGLQRQAHREDAAAARALAVRLDRPVVLGDDLMTDEQAQPRALPCPAPCEKRLEDVLQHVGLHAATGVV